MTELVIAPPAALAARATIAHHSKSFALASRLLDARTRDHAAVVYAFCRRADDAVDDVPRAAAGAALATLERELADIYAGAPIDPVLAAFAEVVRARAIPRRYPAELLAGMAMDATGTRYTTLAELHAYCFRVAGVVGLMMCHVFGVRDDAALVPAARLGVAMQLTNICRDVAEDWARDRLYLPDELLARHGAGGLAGELHRPLPASTQPAIAATVRELLALADLHYRAAEPGLPALPWRAALAVRAARSVYAAIGDRVCAVDCDVTAGRAVVPRATKLALVAGAALRTVCSLPRLRAPRIPTTTLEARDVPLA
ncbi:MAG TPA: phytoene/squalene synthase family protein [Kofleriaceae bacterium]|nr:phytoene/squalene synthase family protein [Kofleriaceae bacterium]